MKAGLSSYSFCEPVYVTGPAPWCIRKLTGTGRHVGGGVDSTSLCGRVKCHADGGLGGWDLTSACVVSLDHPHACKQCIAILKSESQQ